MNVGDVVIPTGDTRLASGSNRYDCAIVANMLPFAIVSVDGDMLWTKTICASNVKALCRADASIVAHAVRRYELYIADAY